MTLRGGKRRPVARGWGAAVAVSVTLLAGCDATPPAMTSASAPGASTREPVAPIVHGPGAVDLGLKWNTFLTPPLTYADAIGWGATFTEVEWCATRDLGEGERFAATDRALAQAQGYGFTMMIKLRVGDCSGHAVATEPDEDGPKNPSSAPEDPARYAAWVEAMVRRYAPRGVRTWAVENEVDAANFWTGTPQEYAETARLVSGAVHAVDPTAVVLDAGVSSTAYGVAIAGDLLDAGRESEALAFYQAYYARRLEGGVSRFPAVASVTALRRVLTGDRAVRARAMIAANWEVLRSGVIGAYQLHFYEDPAVLPSVLDYVENHLTARIPVQAWEVGTAWPGPSYDASAHAADLIRDVGVLLARRVSPIVYLPLAFTPRPGKRQVFRGLVAPDGALLPAGEVFRRIATSAKTSASVLPVALGNGVTGRSSAGGSAFGSSSTSEPVPAGGGAILVGTGASLGLLWTATRTPALVDLPGGRDAALAAASRALGEPVTPAG